MASPEKPPDKGAVKRALAQASLGRGTRVPGIRIRHGNLLRAAVDMLGERPSDQKRAEADEREASQQQERDEQQESIRWEFHSWLWSPDEIHVAPGAWKHSQYGRPADQDRETIWLLAQNKITDDDSLRQWLIGRAMKDFIVTVVNQATLSFSIYFPGSGQDHVSGTMLRGTNLGRKRFRVSHMGKGGLY